MDRAEYQRAYREANRDRIRTLKKDWAKANPERVRAHEKKYYDANPGKSGERNRRWKERHPGRESELARARHKAAPHKGAAKAMARHARRLNATPAWFEAKEVAELYAQAHEKGMHVDHIVPLRGKFVCGLHCMANLQLLTPKENFDKGSYFHCWWLGYAVSNNGCKPLDYEIGRRSFSRRHPRYRGAFARE